jgi:mannosyltransferase OCH1-like enzyme
MIPKTLHFIWIGDESKMPNKCIDTWRVKNPEYGVRVWGNYELHNMLWHNIDKVRDMLAKKDYAGVADIMRYEILYNEGGVYIDADSVCLKPLEDWLLDCDAFACWEQEFIRNNLVANGFIGSIPGSDVMKMCIDELATRDCTVNKLAWQITGPLLLTDVFFKKQPNLTVYPSHFFMPRHHTGYESKVTGHRFADHIWGSDTGYDNMNERAQ